MSLVRCAGIRERAVRVLAWLALGLTFSCQGPSRHRRSSRAEPPPRSAQAADAERGQAAAAYAPGALPVAPHPPPARRILPAARDDEGWSGTESVDARRLVYRVTLKLPGVLGVAPPTISEPVVTELFIDVSAQRLRARFVGSGWPVEAGAEVRLRSDLPGTYVFDAHGGQPLGPGQLARWFQGGPVTRSRLPAVGLLAPHPNERSTPGALVCALLAEWSGQDRANLLRRCSHGAPARFRLGPWRGERTADVPVHLPREALRADHVHPPAPIAQAGSRAFIGPSLLSRVAPLRSRRASERHPAGEAPGEGIRVLNRGRTRVVIIAHGVPIGWVDAGSTGLFVGLRSGVHLIAGIRPLGNLGMRPQHVRLPAEIIVH